MSTHTAQPISREVKATLEKFSNAHPAGFREIPPEGVVRNPGIFRMIDVRQPEEFTGELGHIQGAELVPLSTVQQAAVHWNREQPLLMVCRSGGRSATASSWLKAMGFTQVYNLVGGMLVWNANGLPIIR